MATLQIDFSTYFTKRSERDLNHLNLEVSCFKRAAHVVFFVYLFQLDRPTL